MTTYKESGVDVSRKDSATGIAYSEAKKTFSSRKGMIGEPVTDNGGYAGLLDMGDFYLVQNDDGIGTKVLIAEQVQKFDTLGYDLLCMVADDAICMGAEVISASNTMDVDRIQTEKVREMMGGFAKAAREQKIVIPGGEIAELNVLSNGYIWNSTSVGVVKKDRLITGKDVAVGDKLISLYSPGFRSNGLSLVRHILEKAFGKEYGKKEYKNGISYGHAALTPSVIFHAAVLNVIGRFHEKPKVKVKGIAHITGCSIAGNLPRILKKKGLGARIDNAWEPDGIVLEIQKLGKVEDREAYETWNMGNGMFIVANETEKVISLLKEGGIQARVAGEIADTGHIELISKGAITPGETLTWKVEE